MSAAPAAPADVTAAAPADATADAPADAPATPAVELPRTFEEFNEQRRQSFLKVKDFKQAGGRLVVIDGGFCRAYQKQTGIAGYTMFFSSHGMRIASHEPFAGKEDAIRRGTDITSHSFIVENLPQRLLVGDTDTGDQIRTRIDELQQLLRAYRSGRIKTNTAPAPRRRK